jgi:hypothetical protein
VAKRHPDLLFDPDTDADPDFIRFSLSFSFRQSKDSFFPAIGRGASLGWRVLLVLRHVQVQESSDHLLVLRVMLASFALEESNARFAQTNRDLDLLFAKSKFGGRREKVPNDVNLANGAVSVCDFSAHRSFCLSANIRRRRCE